MDKGEDLERELEEAMKLARVPASVQNHYKGCKTCVRRFNDCDHGSLYRGQVARLARSPCASWQSCGLQNLEDG